ncbi:unnamed protein product [Rotaria sp. Silwood2]|nr:unnamed protein product [Rotaria sp. Silwood2]
MSSDEEERLLKKQIFKNPVEIQKARLDRLMKNVEKPVFIPETKEMKAPRAFQPHEFVRNVMGASAGAGSGEFDIYRGCRRRQMIREAYLSREAKEVCLYYLIQLGSQLTTEESLPIDSLLLR